MIMGYGNWVGVGGRFREEYTHRQKPNEHIRRHTHTGTLVFKLGAHNKANE